MRRFHIYIKFPIDLERHIASPQEGREFTLMLQIILDRADCEHGVKLYFEESNKQDFLNCLETILDLVCYTGAYEMKEAIQYLLFEANAKNWEDGPLHEQNEEKWPYYKEFNPHSRNFEESPAPVLKEITEKTVAIIDPVSERCLFLDILGSTSRNPIPVIRVSKDIKTDLINISVVTNFKELEIYFETQRIKRIYNHNDNRHIEGHARYIPGKSPLIGGNIGKINAESLLQSAIGDQHKHRYLINFDPANSAYIRYEDEGFQCQYHGYHLVQPGVRPHTRDTIAENEIPLRIISILEYRMKN
ncbi:hypothetical protein [Chitinophaga eiseniae]|uniref:Uncharacterized protein n=1 Tax=Chitinophaga eiseniae TaxID=634771 RepID=A0A847SQS3_9BACT|nr:hypothetical protein [Chitinophaga eiseniae]NLR79669.1 hypothetical protein [Chitinophaga eiseniae]